MKKITDYLSNDELLAQLAEEAAELSQAALKLRRALTGINPTPVTVKEADANLIEEAADVGLVLYLLISESELATMEEISTKKYNRWLKRLEEHRKNENKNQNGIV